MPAVLNAANEVAVDAFLREKVSLTSIPLVVEKTMDAHRGSKVTTLNDVLAADSWARDKAAEILKEQTSGNN